MTVAVRSYYGEPGGERLSAEALQASTVKADLARLLSNFSLAQASKIAEAVLARYELKEKL